MLSKWQKTRLNQKFQTLTRQISYSRIPEIKTRGLFIQTKRIQGSGSKLHRDMQALQHVEINNSTKGPNKYNTTKVLAITQRF